MRSSKWVVNLPPNAATQCPVVADVDGDGFLDLVVPVALTINNSVAARPNAAVLFGGEAGWGQWLAGPPLPQSDCPVLAPIPSSRLLRPTVVDAADGSCWMFSLAQGARSGPPRGSLCRPHAPARVMH